MVRPLLASTLVACGLIASGPLLLSAQAPAPERPVRDVGPAPSPVGKGVIRGRVIDGQTGRPLRRARITLTAPELPRPGLATSTDAAGTYELTDVPAGRFTLTAQRSGYLQLRYGQRRPLEQGTTLEMAEGEALEGVDFALPRMAAISGRVTDELGEPIEGVWVTAQRFIYRDNRRRLMPDGPIARTDDEGQYRIASLVPGTYFVNARTLDKWTVTDGDRDETMGYAPSYFPGVTDPAQALRLTVASGEEAVNTDFSLVPGRAARISGTAVDSQGRPIRNVSLVHELMGTGGGLVGIAGSGTVSADGRFEITRVPPGEYKLQATGPQESVTLPVVVNGVDLTDVALTTSLGWSATGRVVIDSDQPAELRRNQVTIAAAPIDGRNGMGMSGGAVMRQAVNDDWTFSVSGVVGAARLRANVPAGWAVKGILQGERDIAELPLDMRSGEELGGLQVVVTDRVATLGGPLRDRDGAPARDGTVLVFTADTARWYEGSRLVHAVRPDQQGRYLIDGVLPGDYFAVALDYVEQGIWNDPEYLESIRAHALRVSIAGPGDRDVPLTVVTP